MWKGYDTIPFLYSVALFIWFTFVFSFLKNN